MSYRSSKIFNPPYKKYVHVAVCSFFFAGLVQAFEFGQNGPIDSIDVKVGDKTFTTRQEQELKSKYVGHWQLVEPAKLFPPNENNGELNQEQKDFQAYYPLRLFTTEVDLPVTEHGPTSPLSRYYVRDLQYDVMPNDADGNALPIEPGLRLIPVSSTGDVFRIPSPVRQRYPDIIATELAKRGASPTDRTYDEQTVNIVYRVIRAAQTAAHDPHPYTDADIATFKSANKEPSVSTDIVEQYATQLAYGADDKELPIHLIVPHTSDNEFKFTSIQDLAAPSSKPQTSIHHTSGFYRFGGVPKDSRRSMLSDYETTNLRMVFSKSNQSRVDPRDSIKATQLNLAFWFMLYYENIEGYAFSENYEFDDSYMTNLEEVGEMARGWLDRSYVRQDFNARHAARLVQKFASLMAPINKIQNGKAGATNDDLDKANENLWQIQTLVQLIFGDDAGKQLSKAQNGLWEVINRVKEQNLPNLSLVRLTGADQAKLGIIFKLLADFSARAPAEAGKIPYYKILQKDPALAEYCNEGVKDQVDKGLNIPLSRFWLKRIYPAAQAEKMFVTAERNLCEIQIVRSREDLNLTAEQQKALKADPCKFGRSLDPSITVLSEKEDDLNKMTPLWAQASGGIDGKWDETNPLLPQRDDKGVAIGGFPQNKERDAAIRKIGNSLAYGPQTTLDIIAHFVNAYLPFHKAGAVAAAAVAGAFIPEHFRRTGIPTTTYVEISGKILTALFAGEAKIVQTNIAMTYPGTDNEQKRKDEYAKYAAGVAGFFQLVLPAQIDKALAGQTDDNNDDDHPRRFHAAEGLPADHPAISGAQVSSQLFAAIQPSLNAAVAAPPEEFFGTPDNGGRLQFPFRVYKKTIEQVDGLIDTANRENKTVPANPLDALYQGTKRVKFYFQPGMNSLDHMGFVKHNPNVWIVDLGTAIKSTKVRDMSQIEPQNKQWSDLQIDKHILHDQITEWVLKKPEANDIAKYKAGQFDGDIVDRP